MVDLGFLTSRRERAIMEGVRAHLAAVAGAVEAFVQGVEAAGRGDAAAAQTLVSRVTAEEKRADGIHRDLSLKVAQGAFFGGVREDILELLEKIDNIADSAKDAARFLSSDSNLEAEAVGILSSENMRLFLADLKSSVAALTDLVLAFDRGKDAVLSKVHSVEDFEEEADSHKDAVLKDLFGRSSQMSPVNVIQLRDFIFVADDIADNAEDASDVTLVLIAKGYG